MSEYIDKKHLDRKFQIDMMCLRGGTILDTQKIIDSLPSADVVERSEYEKLLKENEELKETYQNCIDADLQSCEELAELRSKIDKAIAEIKEVSFKHHFELGQYIGEETVTWEVVKLDHVLNILKRNIGE